jgi:hypothetical protein
LAYNVTAVQQTDPTAGTGPAYLLNGLSDVGYWYQVGVSWNWNPGTSPGTGFDMLYEVFNTTGGSIFPSNGGGGLQAFSGAVNNGDTVLLSMYFSPALGVVMSAKDYNTGASASQTYSSEGASEFIGLTSSSNSNGFFTGLMTEWYHASAYYSNEAKVVYSNSTFGLSGGIMWADEFTVPNLQPLFGQELTYTFQEPLLAQGFSSNGVTAYANAYVFVTGTMNVVPLTVTYSVSGGGIGYSPPTLSFTFNGAAEGTPFSVPSVTFYVDSGTKWGFSNQLSGSTSSERWQSAQLYGGTATSAQTISLVYYHQYSVLFAFSVLDGGSGYSPPTVTFTQFGIKQTSQLAKLWADAGGSYSYPPQLPGSTSDERWSSQSNSGVVSSTATVNGSYYHQYQISFSYSTTGGGSPTPPTLISTQFGSAFSVGLTTAPVGNWLDSGAHYSVTPNPLQGSTSTERYYATTGVGVVSNAVQVVVTYNHQFLLQVSGLSTPSQWYDSGSTATISAPETFGRQGGIGSRITSYAVDTGPSVQVALQTGNLTIKVAMNSTHSLTFKTVKQYQVTLDSNATAALSSITSPTISGDQYWYDSGSQVSVELNGVWGRVAGAGVRLSSYTVNGGNATQAINAGTVSVLSVSSISSLQSVTVTVVKQYQLSTPTGSVESVTPPTISGDSGWYDSGTPVRISFDNVWNTISQQSRLAATGYSIDGGATESVPEEGAGTFSASLTMSSAHTIDVKSVMEYYTTFEFTDASGTKAITPASIQISIAAQVQSVPGFAIWLNNGTHFTISNVTYEGEDVKPSTPTQYSVTGPNTIGIEARVYDATVKVTDFLGFVVSGAQVKMTLVNGTIVSGTTNSDGAFVARQMPLGTFVASVSSFGTSTQVMGDASKQSVTPASVLLGTVSLGFLVLVAGIAAGTAVFMARRRSKRGPAVSPTRLASEATAYCSNCGAPVGSSETFCSNCGARIR